VPGTYVIPFAWAGPAVGVDVRLRVSDAWALRLEGDVEARRYGATGYLLLTDASGMEHRLGERTRENLRAGGAASVTWRPSAAREVSARYDVLVKRSNVDSRLASPARACAAGTPDCHAWDATDANFVRHVVSLSAHLAW